MKYILYALIFTFSITTIQAQEGTKKAQKIWSQYRDAMNKGEREKAVELLHKTVEEDPNFKKARKERALYYVAMKDYDNALKDRMYIIDNQLKLGASDYYYAGRDAFKGRKYEACIPLFEEMLGFSSLLIGMKEEGTDWMLRAQFILKAKANPYPFSPINMGPAINSRMDEYLPSITADKQTFIYTRKLDYDGKENEDFYMSNWDGSKWTNSFNVGSPVNTEDNEGAQSITADGRYIFFTKCNVPSNDPKLGAVGGCDIYATDRKGKDWGVPFNLGETVNTPFFETMPSMSADGKTLYFVAKGRKGGLGGYDIWISKFENGKWQTPVNAGPNINTKKDEQSPFIHPDGVTLYFSSNGHIGMGDFDFFVASKDHEGKFKEPINLGYPINDEGIERGLYVNTDGTVGYISSEREGGHGGLDMYYFDLPEHAQPAHVTYVKGIVSDAKTKKKIGSDVELLDLANGESHTITWSDDITGEYLVCLPAGKNYALNVSKDGYLFHSENFSLDGVDLQKPYEIDVALEPIEVGKSVVLKNIFFELGSAELMAASDVELNKLLLYLNQNETVKVEVGGHSDSTGEDDFNLKLSEERAKSVCTWLMAKNVHPERVSYKGYGETSPIASNDTEAGRSQNRRTEFKIIGK